MTTYTQLLDGLDDVYLDDEQLKLEMVHRGKHYDEAMARNVLKGMAKSLRRTADTLDRLAAVDDKER